MHKLGYGPGHKLRVKVATRDVTALRDPAVILADQLKKIYIDGELDIVETANWWSKLARRDFRIGFIFIPGGVVDPDQQFYENYACGSERNYSGYCNRDIEKLFDQQSMESNQEKRKQLVWEIDKKLQGRGQSSITHESRPAGSQASRD